MIQRCVVNPSHASPQHVFVKRGTDVYTCPTCGSVMADLEHFVHQQYEQDSYYTMSMADRPAIDGQWGFRWRYILRAIRRHARSPRILDVGAGNGYFVHIARSEFALQADGLEISQAEKAYAREMFGIEFVEREALAGAAPYDVVGSFNVIEHVTGPLSLFQEMSSWLRPGGHLVLTTPNPACIHRRVLGLERWSMVCPPHHINLFTRQGLQELLASAGFEVLEYGTLSTYINFVRRIDTQSLLLRRTAFRLLKAAHLGADHFMICRKAGPLH